MSEPVPATRSGALALFLSIAVAMTLTQTVFVPSASAQEKAMNLFKIVTVKDDIVIGLSDDELETLGGRDAGCGPGRHCGTCLP